MIPRLYLIRNERDAARVAGDLVQRVKYAGPCDCYVTQAGEKDERAKWMARYHKLMALLAEQVVQDGQRYSPRVWDLACKDMFLVAEEIRLPSGKVVLDRPRKSEMKREQREEFLDRVREFAAEHGVFLQHPEEVE